MRTRVTLGIAALATVLSSLTFVTLPAHADTGIATIQGAGTVGPGLTTTPTAQNYSLSGSGPIVVANRPSLTGVYTCNISGGSSWVETVAVGQGSFAGSCSGPTTVAIDGAYTRYGEFEWLITGQFTGAFNASYTGVCTGAPSSAPTVTSFRIACQLALH